MNEHLGTWTQDLGNRPARLDLWDTGRVDSYGKSELRYALWIGTEAVDERGVFFDGEDFHPSPLHAIDSDKTAGGLIGFFAAYGDPHSGADAPEGFSAKQRETLENVCDALYLWSEELEADRD